MSLNLVEMALAIALAGLVFAGAIVPVTQTVVAYQESEDELRDVTTHYLAAQRVERLAASIWRAGDAPANHGTLQKAVATRLSVGVWDIHRNKQELRQEYKGGGAALIAQPIEKLGMQYLLDDGSWQTAVKTPDLGRVVALRYQWQDADHKRAYRGLIVPTDRVLADRSVALPKPLEVTTYRRSDYEQKVELKLEPWK